MRSGSSSRNTVSRPSGHLRQPFPFPQFQRQRAVDCFRQRARVAIVEQKPVDAVLDQLGAPAPVEQITGRPDAIASTQVKLNTFQVDGTRLKRAARLEPRRLLGCNLRPMSDARSPNVGQLVGERRRAREHLSPAERRVAADPIDARRARSKQPQCLA